MKKLKIILLGGTKDSTEIIQHLKNNYDTYILTYRWCENNNYIADWKNETIKKAE